MKLFFYTTLIILFFTSCKDSSSNKTSTEENHNQTLFTKIDSETSNIFFNNKVIETMDFNFLNYPYLYTGAGVAIGDIDHDGFQDVYLVSNFGPNKLYKNNGDFIFEDISDSLLAAFNC